MLRIGDKVRLTDEGMERIEGLRSWEEVKGAEEMVITETDYSLGDGTWCTIEVTGPLSKYMMTDAYVEKI